MDDLKGAYKDALEAEGSALRENEKYLDSIEGRMKTFTSTLQTMWSNAINSDFIKFWVDAGTTILKVVDTIGLIPSLIGGFTIFNGLKSIFKNNFMKSFGVDLANALKTGVLFNSGGQAALAANLGSALKTSLKTSVLIKWAKGFELISDAQISTMTSTQLLGVSFQALGMKIDAAGKAIMGFIATPLGKWIIGITVAAIALTYVFKNVIKTHKNYVEAIEETSEELRSLEDELKEVQNQLEETNNRIAELQEKGTLSFVEQEELKRLKEQTRQLELQEKILLAQEKRKKKEQAENLIKAFESDKDYDKQNVHTFVDKLENGDMGLDGNPYAAILQEQSTNHTSYNRVEAQINALKHAYENLNDVREKLATTDPMSAEFKDLTKQETEFEDAINEANKRLGEYMDDATTKYGEVGYIDDVDEDWAKRSNEIYRQIQDYRLQQDLLNNELTNIEVIKDVFGSTGSEAAQEFRTAFEDAVKKGEDPAKVIEDLINSGDYSNLFADLENKFGFNTDFISAYFVDLVAQEVAAAQALEDSTKTYTTLASEVEKYKEVLAQTSEIVSDNTLVTQEYRDALVELGISESELNEYFDENNKLIVKDAAGLRKLVSQQKRSNQATIAAAKAQAQLQYDELVQDMRRSVLMTLAQGSAYDLIADATRNNIRAMEDQLEALEQTMQQYALLELSLTNAANAYDEYEKAKERDAQMSYDDSFLEMLKTIDEGLLKNETGTEAFEYAVKAIVPEEFWKDIDDVDEKVKSIHDYIDGNPVFAKLFHVDKESGDLDINADNVREFVKMGLKDDVGVFTGEAGDFDLRDSITGIEDVAEAYGITEAAALALFTALEKVDAKWGDILTQVTMSPFDRKVYNTNKELAEANSELADAQEKLSKGEMTVDEYNKKAEEYRKKTSETSQQLDTYTKEAKNRLLGTDDTAGFVELNKQAAEAQKKVEESTKELTEAQNAYNKAKENGAGEAELEHYDGIIASATEKVNEHTSAWAELIQKRGEYPTEFELSLVIADIDKEIQAMGNTYQTALNQYFETDENGYWVVKTGIEVNIEEIEKAYPGIQEYIKLCNTKTELETYADTTAAETEVLELEKTVGNIIKAIEKNLVTLDLDDKAVQNVVDEINKILGGVISNLGVTVSASLPSWLKSILKFMGFDTSNSSTTEVKSSSTIKAVSGGGSNLNNRQNSQFATGSDGLKTSQHNAIVGELGPELVCDAAKGVYYTVGENGTEMVNLPKGSIIYDHIQTRELLKNGHTTRGHYTGGLSFAKGNAYGTGGIPSYHPNTEDKTSFENGTGINNKWDKAASTLSNAADSVSDAADEFREVFDWIEVRLEEINEQLSLRNAKLENTIGYADKNKIVNEMISINQSLYENLLAGADEYYKYAKTLLAKVPDVYKEAAQNGAIAIEEFAGEADEKTLEAIQEYREWVQKGADATQQAEEVISEISNLAKQAFDNIVSDFENSASLNESQISRLEAYNSLLATDKGFESEDIYQSIIGENSNIIAILQEQKKQMQAELDKGLIKEGTDAWYEAVNAITDVGTEIINLRTENEDLQDSINELHWSKFDLLITQFQAVSDEAENLLSILESKDVVDEFGNWTDDGITSLGLLAQQMEVAEMQAEKYKNEIAYLNENWKELGYTQEEYVTKLEDLKSGQYDSIKAYQDTKNAIKDLTSERVDAVKNGIEKEIEAYSELIEKKKEELNSEKDLYDFQKSIQEKSKNISDIQRKLSALSNDNSASARAQKAKLQAELAEAQADLQEAYYDRSVSDQQDALDKELEAFEERKNKEIEGWDEYLENLELIVSDSLTVVQENTSAVLTTLQGMQEEYGLAITNALTEPWKAGETAIQEYGARLGISLTTLANMFGMTVDEFASKFDLTTDALISGLNITVAQLASTLGLTNDEMVAKLGLTISDISGMMGLTIEQLAANMGITLPILAEQLGVTTAELVGNLDLTMSQFAGSLGLTVDEFANKFGLTAKTLADKLGMTYQELTSPFGLSMSATVEALKALEVEYNNILATIIGDSKIAIDEINKATQKEEQKAEQKVEQQKPTESTNKQQTVSVGSKINAGSATIYADSYGGGAGRQYYASDPNYVVLQEQNGYVLVRHHSQKSGYTGWFKKSDLPKYAKGTTGTNKNQLAILDELGEELILHAHNGRLAYMEKGSGVIPADLTSNLMEWGALDPQIMLDNNRPVIAPSNSVVNTEIKLDCSVGTLVSIEHCDQNTLPDVEKLVNKAFDKHMQNLNNSLKRYTRG